MTSLDQTTDSEVASGEQLLLTSNYVYLAAGTLLLYDAAISCGQEVELIWRKKRSTATFLVAINRILGVLFASGTIMNPLKLPQLSSCVGATIYVTVSQASLPLVWAAFSGLRVYAIGGRAWRMATIVFLLALGPLGIDLYYYSRFVIFEQDILGFICTTSQRVNLSNTAQYILTVIARIFLISADAIVLIVTWRHTYETREQAKLVGVETPLATRLLRDGTLFFAAGFLLNVAQLVIYITSTAYGSTITIDYVVTSISCVITARFFVSLRQSSQGGSTTTLMEPSCIAFESPHTARGAVAVMAGELDIDAILYSNGYVEEEEEEWEGLELDVVEPDEEVQLAMVVEVEEVPV